MTVEIYESMTIIYQKHRFLYVIGDISLKIRLPPRFGCSRARVNFSVLLVFMFGFSRKIYSGLKKNSWKNIENFWSKIDFEIEIGNFSKNFEIFEKIKIFEKSRKIRFFSIQIKLWKFSDFSIFRNFSKILFFRNFRKFSQKFSISISKSIFDQKFSTFSHDLFLKPLLCFSGASKNEG